MSHDQMVTVKKPLLLHGQTNFLAQDVIACSISIKMDLAQQVLYTHKVLIVLCHQSQVLIHVTCPSDKAMASVM